MGQEKLGKVDENVIKAMGAFGGGIASTGRVCGALAGGVALFSSMYSRGNIEEKEDPKMWKYSYKLSKIFDKLTEEFGSADCRDIAQIEWRDREQTKHFYTAPDSRRTLCAKLVGDTAYALGQILDSINEKGQ